MKPLPKPEKFWPKVDKSSPNGCWLWTGALTHCGYGQVGSWLDGKFFNLRSHRVSYELLVGPIPDGLQLDHLCRVRHCVNPAHLEPVTALQNMRRSPLVGRNRRTPVITDPGLIARARRAAGMSQVEAAEAAGVSLETLSRIERGLRTQPRGDVLDRLAEVLGLDPAEFSRPAEWVDVLAVAS